jgi:EAL domain-containing protein (putative c-di-GMP-specific phosphodiesterase class I)
VVAEGVETREQLTFLKTQGCHEAQGYLFSPPVVAETFAPLIQHGGTVYSF